MFCRYSARTITITLVSLILKKSPRTIYYSLRIPMASRHFLSTKTQSQESNSLPVFNYDASFRLTQPPVDSRDPSAHEEDDRQTWDLSETSPPDTYRLLTSAIVPRPIAFVSSISNDGYPNLAPFRSVCLPTAVRICHLLLIPVTSQWSVSKPMDSTLLKHLLGFSQSTVA